MTTRLHHWLLLLALPLAAAERAAPGLRYVEKGKRVKVEARNVPGGRLVAKDVEPAGDEDEIEIEGVIRKLNRNEGTFALGPFSVRVTEKTKLENSRRLPVEFSAIADGGRVKVKARKLEGEELKARTVRTLEDSQDIDLEITATVEDVDLEKSELDLLGAAVKVDRRTNFAGFYTAKGGLGEDIAAARYIRRDDDEQHPDPIRVGNVYLGGRVTFEHERTRNRDLDEEKPDAGDWLRPGVELEVSAPLGEFSEAYAKLNYVRPTHIGNDPSARSVSDFSVREAFLYVGNLLHPSLGLQVGRQRFRDRREWLYDDELDAVRLHFGRSNLKLEAAAAKGLVGPTGSRSDQYYFLANSQYRLPGRRYIGAYVMKRNDLTPRDEDPVWYGLNSRGRLRANLDYWLELSRMMGRRERRLLRGYAYDAGISQRFPVKLLPTLSAGYAFASGDRNLDDGVDGNFRQTGLQDNSYRYNGLKRYRYYGVLTEPELYNLKILTVDLGVRGFESWSLNVSFHDYRQAVVSKRLGDIEFTLRPQGKDPRLGKEIDAVLAIRKFRNIDLNFYGGLFFPGPAFSGGPARAFLFRQELKYYF